MLYDPFLSRICTTIYLFPTKMKVLPKPKGLLQLQFIDVFFALLRQKITDEDLKRLSQAYKHVPNEPKMTK